MEEDGAPAVAAEFSYITLPDGSTMQRDCQYSGEGKMQSPNGDVYEGQFAQGKRHGSGRCEYACGEVYNGAFEQDHKAGLGRMQYKNQDIYHGYFVNGLKHGEGTCKYANGDIYCGQWCCGEKHGNGVYVYTLTKYKLAGEWERGLIKKGRWLWTDGTQFVGQFCYNKPSGQGVWLLQNGNQVEGVYSQQVLPIDDGPDGDPEKSKVPQAIEIKWLTKRVSHTVNEATS